MVATIIIGSSNVATAGSAEEIDLLAFPVPSVWQKEFAVRTAAGYNDNVSLAPASPMASAFSSFGLEGIVSRLPDTGPTVDFFFVFDDLRYLSSGPVEKEQFGFAHVGVKQELDGGWTPSLAFDYVYQDQVLDVSITEVDLAAVQVQGHTLLVQPSLRWDVTPRLWAMIDYAVARQYFSSPLDDQWEIGPELTIGFAYGHKSSVIASYESLHRDYDSDQRLDANGRALTNSSGHRVFAQQDVQLRWQHCWDEARHWRTTLRGGFKFNRDNGGGYFDYDKAYAGVQLLYRRPSWETLLEVRGAQYDYLQQRIAGPESSLRTRDEMIVRWRAEKKVTRYLKVFAEYEYERTLANDLFEEYEVNVITAGCNWIF